MGESKYAVELTNVNKYYKMYKGSKDKLMDLVLPKGAGKEFYALKDISIQVEKGEVVGLIGLNGSGKSTLSNILGGVSLPSSGEVIINGEPSLIAIGIGLNNFLTGLENIEVKSLMMGFKKDEIEKIKEEVIEFADIGEFIDQPIRTYSSGMRSRLGFAIAILTNPDILVIDEALSVGDPTFTQKCLDKMNEFKAEGKTIFFVSHSLSQVQQFCNKVMWIEYGRLREYGESKEIIPKYQEYINMINRMTKEERKQYKLDTLKQQEHSLLREYKLRDQSMMKIRTRGKIVSFASLISIKRKIKVIPYNFDYLTAFFGPLPSLFRKQFLVMGLLILAEFLSVFIFDGVVGIVMALVCNQIFALFTGRKHSRDLVLDDSYIPFDIWATDQNSDINKEKYKNIITKSIDKQCKFIIALIIAIGLAIAGFGIYIGYYEENASGNIWGDSNNSENSVVNTWEEYYNDKGVVIPEININR
ncbi:MAG: teichoic acids export ABC transporter ATP-binding subunit TagH [Clostridium sp.]